MGINERASTVIAVLAVAIVIWEIVVRMFGVREFLLPAPSAVAAAVAKNPAFYLEHLVETARVTLAGFGAALALGVVIAVLAVHSKFLEHALYSLLVAFNSLPKVALAPLFVMWLGTGSPSKVMVAVTIAVFPIVIDTALGLRSVDPEAMNMARAMRASRAQVLFRIRFPNALPGLFAGMKVGISLALVGTVVGEFVAGNVGLGGVILSAQGTFNTPMVFAAIVLLGVLGTLLFYSIDFLERRFIPWHASQRESAAIAGSASG